MNPNSPNFPHFPTSNLESQLGFSSMEHRNPPLPLKLPKQEPLESNDPPLWLNPLPNLHSLEHHRPATSMGSTISLEPILPFPKPPTPASEIARKRRRSITEKTRSLAKLLPWERKMHTEAILGEAFKYVKFLQAQVSVLQSMPDESMMAECGGFGFGFGGVEFGGLEKLNRQQLLQVLVNSPAAQAAMASQGSCVYSLEQLVLLKMNLEEQMEFSGSSTG